jgi:acetylornithine deacetylase/succinyl-diaminopimelate desuccinylase-like protein
MLNQRVAQYLLDNRQTLLERLFEFLRLPSIANAAGQPDYCQIAAKWLADYAQHVGLDARVWPVADKAGQPHKSNVFASSKADPDKSTLLIYGHYDVQPPDPLDQWKSPPFEPTIRDGKIFARGAHDDKGQLFAHLCAIEAWNAAGGGLPVNVKIISDGEEEIGSPTLEQFLIDHKEMLAADGAVISDTEFFAPGLPSIIYALRGVAYAEVTFEGPNVDIHSGHHGGPVANPINALARFVASLHDADGRVTIPGFYDGVASVDQDQRDQWSKLGFDEASYARSLGVDALPAGEKGYSVLERRWARPTLDCNGFTGGYSGKGSKTIIPAAASVKITMRLVPNQDPAAIGKAFSKFIKDNTPPGIRSHATVHASARPVILGCDTPAMKAAKSAMAQTFGREPAMICCGASIPVAEMMQRILGIDPVLMGLGLPDDNLHSPNEKFNLDQLWNGANACATLLQEFSASAQGRRDAR